VHAVANGLLEHEELIGEELDQIYAAVEDAHPELKTPFVRKTLELPRPFDERWRKSEVMPIPAEIAATGGP